MKVISVIQPWASLLASGVKQIETRSWATSHRGQILIHASAKKMRAIDKSMYYSWHVRFGIPELTEEPKYGAIIGMASLVACKNTNTSLSSFIGANAVDLEKALGDYSPRRYMWVMENPVIFKIPIPAKGRLGLWDYDLPIE